MENMNNEAIMDVAETAMETVAETSSSHPVAWVAGGAAGGALLVTGGLLAYKGVKKLWTKIKAKKEAKKATTQAEMNVEQNEPAEK